MRSFCLFFFLLAFFHSHGQDRYLFIGTYTGTGSKGIYVYRFDTASGTATWISNTDSAANPSFLALSADNRFLYSVNETGGKDPGKVSAYAFDRITGKLNLINQQLSGGDHPCYITASRTGKFVIAGNYSGGNFSVFPVMAKGGLGPAVQKIQHTGSGNNKERQEKPHVHATVLSPDEKVLLVPDLGLDVLRVYYFTKISKLPIDTGRLKYSRTGTTGVKSLPGSGPRHVTFHPSGKFLYLVEELSGTVTAYGYKKGALYFIQRMSTHPRDYGGAIGSADIHVSPDGKHLYASNRGDANSLAIFSINSKNGKLLSKGFQSTLGVHPRNFALEPGGGFLLVANRDSDEVVVFRRNPATGLLRDTGNRIRVPRPVCLQFGPE